MRLQTTTLLTDLSCFEIVQGNKSSIYSDGIQTHLPLG